LVATAALSVDGNANFSGGGGAEVGWSWLDGYSVAMRAGLRSRAAGEELVTAGAGFTMDRLSIDYALETLAGSRVAHRVGLRIR